MKTLISLLLLLVFSTTCLADMWIDPEFDEMIDSSVAIVLGEITHGGPDYSEIKILKSFKGNFSSNIIYAGGYSGRLGPYDTLKNGERYYFFFDTNPQDLPYVFKKIEKYPDLEYFRDKIEPGNFFTVWTPTAGDILYDEDGVHADFVFNRSYKGYNDPIPSDHFEKLLSNRINKTKDKQFIDFVFNRFEELYSDGKFPLNLQYYSMLSLLGSRKFSDVIEEASQDTFALTRYLTAKYLKNVSKNKSRPYLIDLMEDPDPLVQSEAIRVLKYDDPEIIGPLFLEKIDLISQQNTSLANDIMDPRANIYESGFNEIVSAFIHMGYKKAAPKLISFLERSEDYYFFRDLLEEIDSLDRKALIPFVKTYLKPGRGSYESLFQVVYWISENKIEECKDDLINFIKLSGKDNSIPNRSDDNIFLISDDAGLGAFDDPQTKDFMINDFLNLIEKYKTEQEEGDRKWIEEYIDLFGKKHYTEAKESIYSLINIDSMVNPASLFDLYEDVRNKYFELENVIDSVLQYEHIESNTISLVNQKYYGSPSNEIYPYRVNFYSSIVDERYPFTDFGIIYEEEMPDSIKSKFNSINEYLKNLTGCDLSEIKIGSLGIFYDQYCVEDREQQPEFLYEILTYFLENPDPDNFLNFVYLNNKYLNGSNLDRLIQVGNLYY